MFLGVVPVESLHQIVTVSEFSTWPAIYSCCSGTFRIERAITANAPGVPLHASDVSLFSCAIGSFFAGNPLMVEFTGDLEWIEGFLPPDPGVHRAAAVLAASELTRFAVGSRNRYKDGHLAHLKSSFPQMLDRGVNKLVAVKTKLDLASFSPRDLVDHIDIAIERGAGVVAFPPFFKGGYEAQFKYLDDNTRWQAPSYTMFDPDTVQTIVDKLDASGVPYTIGTDKRLVGHEPKALLEIPRRPTHYVYSSGKRTSYLHAVPTSARAEPFAYELVNPAELTANSKIEAVRVSNPQAAFVKNIYLQAGMFFADANLTWLLLVDGKLLGLVAYRKPMRMFQGVAKADVPRVTEILSDPSFVSTAKLSKLVSLCAFSAALVKPLDRKMIRKTGILFTTARTNNMASMKYRGVAKLHSRRPAPPQDETGKKNVLIYTATPRTQSIQELYREWWTKWGAAACAAHRNRNSSHRPGGAETERTERALHGAEDVQSAGTEPQA